MAETLSLFTSPFCETPWKKKQNNKRRKVKLAGEVGSEKRQMWILEKRGKGRRDVDARIFTAWKLQSGIYANF